MKMIIVNNNKLAVNSQSFNYRYSR